MTTTLGVQRRSYSLAYSPAVYPRQKLTPPTLLIPRCVTARGLSTLRSWNTRSSNQSLSLTKRQMEFASVSGCATPILMYAAYWTVYCQKFIDLLISSNAEVDITFKFWMVCFRNGLKVSRWEAVTNFNRTPCYIAYCVNSSEVNADRLSSNLVLGFTPIFKRVCST